MRQSQSHFQSQYLCVSPWLHLHVWPNANVYPCCMTPPSFVAGNLGESSLTEVWNSDLLRSIRRDMLAGKAPPSCQRCHALEASGHKSFRNYLNQRFAHHLHNTAMTLPNGSVEKMTLAYWDIRFSNICNFRCRTCGPELSSAWHEDHKKLDPLSTTPKLQKLANTVTDLWHQLEPHLADLEEVNFVGGEPMLMEDHWKILAELDRRGLHNVNLKYNTNFSTLTYRNFDAVEWWKKFKQVELHISLDGSHTRGEYLRKGLDWKKVETQRKRLLHEIPNLNIFVNSTVSNLNGWHILDFHEEWLQKGYLRPAQIILNPLIFPDYYRIQVLPQAMKENILEKFIKYEEKWRSIWPKEEMQILAERMKAVVHFMLAQDGQHHWPEFLKITENLDQIRSERFYDTFPEFQSYLNIKAWNPQEPSPTIPELP